MHLARYTGKNALMSEAMWRLVDKRVSVRQDTSKDQTLFRRLRLAFTESFRGDRQQRTEESGAEVELLLGLDPPIHQEVLHWIQG